MGSPLYIAVDLGAGSGRVFLAGLDPGELLLEEIHRFQYPPLHQDGHLRWDFGHIFSEIKLGLRNAGERARELGRCIRSLGVDTWGVDYGLIGPDGLLVANPICYRDDRTQNAMSGVFGIIPKEKIFEKTGIQFQNFNTIYQLCSESIDLSSVSKLLLLPDLINYFLTGRMFAEYTNATTMQLVNSDSKSWDPDLCDAARAPISILPEIVPAGTDLGPLLPELVSEIGLQGINVIAPATHDTGSAVAAAPLEPNTAYISSGTWSLIGVENREARIGPEIERQNFTNEGGAYGTIRFLKNVMGLWIFESCRREWKAMGTETDYDALIREIDAIKGTNCFIFPDDARFLNPPSMLEAISRQLEETGQKAGDGPAAISKVIFDSLAFRYASVLRSIENLTGREVAEVLVLGGGGRNVYLNQMTADASGLPVKAGLTEATVVGNVLVQAVASGRFESLAEGRRHVDETTEFTGYFPRHLAKLEVAASRYRHIESIFDN